MENSTAADKNQREPAKEKGVCDSCREAQPETEARPWDLFIGLVIFAGTEMVHVLSGSEDYLLTEITFLGAAYLFLGGRVLAQAWRNLRQGQICDENFLMSIATLGALAIRQYPEAVGVMLFYRIGEFFEDLAVVRGRRQIIKAVDLRPETVRLWQPEAASAAAGMGRDGKFSGTEKLIPAAAAKVGDQLRIKPGDRIPLDGTIVQGSSSLDTSAVTGEALPVQVKAGCQVLSGCMNISGALILQVDKILQESMVTKILASVENAAAAKPKLDRFITRFAKVYTPVVILLALGTAVLPPWILGQPYYPWLYTALTFLVMSCPCALVLSVPLAFFCGIGAGSAQGILFKSGLALEALSRVRNVVLDKTGTLTKGDFTVQEICPAEGWTEDRLLQLAASLEQISNHPVALSLVKKAQNCGLKLTVPDQVRETAGLGMQGRVDGQIILCGNQKMLLKKKIALPSALPDTDGKTIVLAAVDGVYAGAVFVSDTLKADAAQAVADLQKLGLDTFMLTGDNEKAAASVAALTGIKSSYSRLLPDGKLQTLLQIRRQYGSVLFVGDGINDAPVLAGADVGAAMGSGADAAIETADVVFLHSQMSSLPLAWRLAKKTVKIAYQNVTVALAVKAVVFLLGLTGIYANMWLAVFADSGVALLCVLNSLRMLFWKKAP